VDTPTVPIDLTGPGEGTQHVFGFTRPPVTFTPSTAVNSANGTITIANHGFRNGDAVVYATDPTVRNSKAVTRSAFVSSAALVSFGSDTQGSGPIFDPGADTLIFPQAVNLVTGQRVTYQTPGVPIGGLKPGVDYYVIRLYGVFDRIQVAASRTAALAGQAVDLLASTPGPTQQLAPHAVSPDGELIVPNHGLSTGQQVTYQVVDGSPITGLTDGQPYFVIALDGNRLMLAASAADAQAGTAVPLGGDANGLSGLVTSTFVMAFDAAQTEVVVNATTDTIRLPGHGFTQGQAVTYFTAGGQPVPGLQDLGQYRVIVVDADHLQLAPPTGDLTPVDLGVGGTLGDGGFHSLGADAEDGPSSLFDPTPGLTVDTTADTIRIAGHGFATGDTVTYLAGGGTPVGGLVPGRNYYVIAIDENTIRLADATIPSNNPNDPSSLVPVDLSGGATGNGHGLERASVATAGDNVIRGLGNGLTYYVTVIDANTISLSASPQSQAAGQPIALNPAVATGVNHTLAVPTGSGITVTSSLTANDAAQSAVGIGQEPNVSDFLTKGELQNPGFDFFRPSSFLKASQNSAVIRGIFSTEGSSKVLSGQGSDPNEMLTLSTGFAFLTLDHTVQITVGPTAVLRSGTDVTVDATVSQKAAVSGQGNITSNNANKKFALGAAVAVGLYTNKVDTLVSSGAVIDAWGTVKVDAELTYPLLVTPLTLAPFSSFYANGGAQSANLIGDADSECSEVAATHAWRALELAAVLGDPAVDDLARAVADSSGSPVAERWLDQLEIAKPSSSTIARFEARGSHFLRWAAAIAERKGEPAKAIQLWQRAAEGSTLPTTRDHVVRLHRGGESDDRDALADAYATWARTEADPKCAAALWSARGVVDLVRGDFVEAEESLRRAADLAPEDPFCRAALAAVFRADHRFDQLARVLSELSTSLVSSEARASAVREHAQLLDEHLGDATTARRVLEGRKGVV
jgi:hypothetical protein